MSTSVDEINGLAREHGIDPDDYSISAEGIADMVLEFHYKALKQVRSQTIEECLKICNEKACGCDNSCCEIDETVSNIANAIRSIDNE